MKNILLSTSLFVAMGTVAGATTLTTLADEETTIQSWGSTGTHFYGQTITLGSGASLDDILFRIDDGGDATSFNLHVYAWTGSTTSGGNLASTSGATAGVDAMTDVSISTGGIALGAGEWLIGLQAVSGGRGHNWGYTRDDAYAGGDFVFQNNNGNAGNLLGGTFSQRTGRDLAFQFQFDNVAAVPLPAGGLLLLAGLGGFAGLKRRKKQVVEA